MYKHNTTGEEITTEAFNALSAEDQASYSLVEAETTAATEAAGGTEETD